MQSDKHQERSPLLTIRDLSEYLKTKESWIRSQVFFNTIPYLKVGRYIRFDINQINQWLDKNKKGISEDAL